MLDIDFSSVEKLEKDLKTYAKRIYPQANGAMLKKTAFAAREIAQRKIRRIFVTRNKFTAGSIRVELPKGFNPRTQESSFGSVQEYMADQEFGAVIQKRGRLGVNIPTRTASGEGRGSGARRRVVKRALRRGNIRIQNRKVKARSKKQYVVAAIRQAAARGGRNKFIYLPFNKHPGIYKVTGKGKRSKIDQIHDFSKQTVTIRPRPWLKWSADRAAKKMPGFFIRASKQLLRRKGLF